MSASLLINVLVLAWISRTWPAGLSATPAIDLVFEEEDNGSLFRGTEGDGIGLIADRRLDSRSGRSHRGQKGLPTLNDAVRARTTHGLEGAISKSPEPAASEEHRSAANKNDEPVKPDLTHDTSTTPSENQGKDEPEKSSVGESGTGKLQGKTDPGGKGESSGSGTGGNSGQTSSGELGENSSGTGHGSGQTKGSGSGNGSSGTGNWNTGGSGPGGSGSGDQNGDVSGNYQPPVLIKSVNPEYPAKARKMGWEGRVVLELSIDEKGGVKSVTIIESSGYECLDQSAVKAAWKQRYKPASRNGTPAASRRRQSFAFNLKGD